MFHETMPRVLHLGALVYTVIHWSYTVASIVMGVWCYCIIMQLDPAQTLQLVVMVVVELELELRLSQETVARLPRTSPSSVSV